MVVVMGVVRTIVVGIVAVIDVVLVVVDTIKLVVVLWFRNVGNVTSPNVLLRDVVNK